MAASKPPRPSMAPYAEYPLQDLLRRTALRLPEKVAVIDGERRFTYRELDRYSDRFAAALLGGDVSPGDRVALLAPNCVEFVLAFFGILKAGAVVTTMNSGYREREIAFQINDSGAETLIVHEALRPTADAARDDAPRLKNVITINEASGDPGSFWDMIEGAPPVVPSPPINHREDLAALPYSSGTTGLAKGVMLTHFNLTANPDQCFGTTSEAALMTEEDVVLVHLPLFHIYGLQVLMNGAIHVGATQVMMGRFDMDLLLGLLSDHRVTRLFTVPPVGLGLTAYPGVKNHDLSSMRLGCLAAAPSTADLQTRVGEVLNCPFIQGYGMTELSPVANMDYVDPGWARPGSVGPAVADTEEVVVDLESGTTEVAPGEIGELMVRGPQVMKGYYNNPQATSETITEDGWLHTGDIVRMDPDGYVWVLDRKKELIKYKGFQVPPAELEGLLLEHPGVGDVAVIGKEDLEAGEVPKAFVVLRAGANVSEDDLMGFVAGKVATFKQVREVEFIDSIPKNASGKILRRVLVEQERAGAKQ